MAWRALVSAGLLLLLIPLGLTVRFAPLHLPWFWSKYLGSALWAAAVYWLMATLLPILRPLALGCMAGLVAVVVELSRLTPESHIDAFRLTLAGRLLLGRYFSVWNIVAYLLAVAISAAADAQWTPGRRNAKRPPRNG